MVTLDYTEGAFRLCTHPHIAKLRHVLGTLDYLR